MPTLRLDSGSFAEPALAVYLAPLAADGRVLWVGPRQGGGPERLAALGARVLVAQPAEPAMARDGVDGAVRWRRWDGQRLPVGEQERFDLVVVASRARDELVDELERALAPQGLLVVGLAPDGQGSAETLVGDWFRRLQRRFPRVAVVGQAPFHALALARLGEPPGDDVVVDGQLLVEAAAQPPERFFVVAGAHWPEQLASYELVAVPPKGEAAAGDGETATPGEGDGRPASPKEPSDEVREVPQAGFDTSGGTEVERLEHLLAERARELRSLRREMERRGRLVRDLTVRLEELAEEAGRGTPTPSAEVPEAWTERVLQAEAHAEAARFEAQELHAELAELLDGGLDRRLAALEGEARGWRARAAELQELHGAAEARLRLAEEDLRAALQEASELRRALQQTEERFEAELARSRAMEAADDARDDRLAELRGEVAGLRLRLKDREEAVRSWRGRAEALQRAVASLEERLRDRDATFEERAALVTRLQLELADEERRAEALQRRVRQLEEEVTRLREAVVQAAEGGADAAALQLARARLEELEAALRATEARAQQSEQRCRRAEAAARHAREDLDRAEAEVRRLRAELGEAEAARVAAREQLEALQRRQRREEEAQGYLEERLRRCEEERRELKVRAEALARQLEETRSAVEQASEAREATEQLEALRVELQEVGSERDRLRETVDGLRREQAERARRLQDVQREVDRWRQLAERAERERAELKAMLEQLREELGSLVPEGGSRAGATITAVGMEAPSEEREVALREQLGELERELRDQRTLVETLTAQVEERDRRIRELREQGGEVAGTEALRRELLAVQTRLARLQEELELEREARRAAEAASTAGGIPSPQQLDVRRRAREALRSIETLLKAARRRGDEEAAAQLAEVLDRLAGL